MVEFFFMLKYVFFLCETIHGGITKQQKDIDK